MIPTGERLQKEDTIMLVASYGADRAEHATLIVDESEAWSRQRLAVASLRKATLMAGIRIPGIGGQIEAGKARLDAAVR